MVRKLLASLLLLMCLLPVAEVAAQSGDKYWVFFTHKVQESHPPQLSQRSIDRRQRQGLGFDERDYPVDAGFVAGLRGLDVQPLQRSRWLNGVSANLTPAQVTQVSALPFVREVRRIPKVQIHYDAPLEHADKGYTAGYSNAQIKMLNLHHLHSAGHYGQGVLISVMDNGFRNAETNPYLAHLYQDDRVVATYDFVDMDGNPYDGGSHGAYVLSILAAYGYGNIEGSAPGADYILCRTENDASETHQEEDNWVAAMEFGDSIGADIFSTSLGYFNGMQDTIVIGGDTIVDYVYSQLDGNTAIITVAADIAASRGILVVNSAGNNGVLKLNAPADGDSVLAIGSVDSLKNCSGFSSRGPTADGRLKPDVTAMGSATAYIGTDFQIYRGSGTSFSCPMVSGMAACIMQASKSAGGMTLFDAIVRSADRYTTPDTAYGHGIPNAVKAYQTLTGNAFSDGPQELLYEDPGFVVYPTKVNDVLYVSPTSTNPEGVFVDIVIHDLAGRRQLVKTGVYMSFFEPIKLDRNTDLMRLPPGAFTISIKPSGGEVGESGAQMKFILSN